MSGGIVAAVLGLAVLDMLSPAVISVTIYLMLARPRRSVLLLSIYLGTVAVSYFALGVLLLLGLGAIIPTVDPAVLRWVQAGLGVALFAASWFIPDRKSEPEPTSAQNRAFTVRSVVLLGLGTWLFEFYTAVPYFGAISIMTAARLDPSAWLLLLAAYVVIMILPGIVLYLAGVVLRERLRERLEHWQRRLDSSSRNTLRWILGIVGVLVFLDALPAEIAITIP
jgi:cytochrome c biogenesis protein CcdA